MIHRIEENWALSLCMMKALRFCFGVSQQFISVCKDETRHKVLAVLTRFLQCLRAVCAHGSFSRRKSCIEKAEFKDTEHCRLTCSCFVVQESGRPLGQGRMFLFCVAFSSHFMRGFLDIPQNVSS